MMTCSIPAATASSTAYWMIGLATSGSISWGGALVAGRKRVPHPAAGKTAFRTRIEPHGIRVWAGRASIAAVSRTAGRGGSGPVGFRYLPAEGQTPPANGRPHGRAATGNAAEPAVQAGSDSAKRRTASVK